MKTLLALCALVALTAVAGAQQATDPQQPAQQPVQKPVEERPVPDINKSPWSASTSESSDGLRGSRSTTIKRDVGDGWAVGGKVTTPYQEPALGGSGPPGNPLEGARSGTTILGPVLEKKF